MPTNLTKVGRQLAGKVIFFQLIVAIIASTMFSVFLGINSGISAVCGALACLLPGMVFAHLAFKYAGASRNQLVVRSFNQGSKLKLLLTILIFMMAYQWTGIQAMPLLVSYVLTLLAQWPIIILVSRVKH
ncbi:MAG: ATP synthase protein I [Paraglaciecola sp.]|jgi:ATP synthase protein I